MDNQLETKPTGNRLNTRAVVLAVVLFSLIVVGMFMFAFIKQKETSSPAVNTVETQEPDDRFAYITRIDGKHFFVDGVHTIVGEIPMPTPCDLLESNAIVAESYPEQITLDFSVINNADFCAEKITPQRFKVSATASEEASFKALFENRVVELNLIEAAPGESPEEFELFIKG